MNFDAALEWAELLKAIAHPTRLQIVAELLKGTKCVSDFQELLPASQANISQHLTVLRNAEIVKFTQDGSQRCYYLSRPKLIAAVLNQLSEGETIIRKTREDIQRDKGKGVACCVR
jgi:ArsR family transcriptional regulator